jgi:hypothetical protein
VINIQNQLIFSALLKAALRTTSSGFIKPRLPLGSRTPITLKLTLLILIVLPIGSSSPNKSSATVGPKTANLFKSFS